MGAYAAIVANGGSADAVNNAELANPRIVADAAGEITMYTGLVMYFSIITKREVWASDLHSFADVAVVTDHDPLGRAAIWTGDPCARVNDGADTDMDLFRQYVALLIH